MFKKSTHGLQLVKKSIKIYEIHENWQHWYGRRIASVHFDGAIVLLHHSLYPEDEECHMSGASLAIITDSLIFYFPADVWGGGGENK